MGEAHAKCADTLIINFCTFVMSLTITHALSDVTLETLLTVQVCFHKLVVRLPVTTAEMHHPAGQG